MTQEQRDPRFWVYLVTMARAIFGFAYGIPHTIVFSILVITTGLMGFQETAGDLVRVWAICLLAVFGIRVRVRGEEGLPKAGGGILVFNHQSHFDIPVLMSSTRRMIRFGAKIELFSIPFFGHAMRAIGTLPIARDNRAGVMRIYQEAQERFAKTNIFFVLAPEGTRQVKPEIGRFKKGPFIFAQNAKVPIIPVVIRGAHSVLPKKSLLVNVGRLARVIEVDFLAPISTVSLSGDNMAEFVDDVRSKMVAVYAETSQSGN